VPSRHNHGRRHKLLICGAVLSDGHYSAPFLIALVALTRLYNLLGMLPDVST
jgi:hypothetical protein